MNSLQSALFKANQTFVNDRGIQNPSDQQKADPKYIEENADWLQAESDYTNQAGIISAAQASLANASFNYSSTQDSTVSAPIDGTVSNFSLGVGSNVTATGTTYNNSNTSNSASASTGTQVLVLGNFSELSIKAPINEVDISKVKNGQKATVTLDAYPDQTFVGKVTSVDAIGSNSSGVVTFNAYISLVAPPSSIHPGMSSTAVIQITRRDDVLTVPTAAIQTSSGSSTVRVLKNGQIQEVQVETGISSDANTEIVSGLLEGDIVVTGTVATSTSTSTQGASPFSGLNRGFGGFGGGARVSGR
jgi:macrolide-specific efflux system membrane fusion protein